MALKALMLRKKIDDKKRERENLRAKDAEFETREKELETAIGEAKTEEERQTVEESVNSFEAEKKEHKENGERLDAEIRDLEKELEEEEKESAPVLEERHEKRRGGNTTMVRRAFFGMNAQERDAFFADEGMKAFLAEVKALKTRAAGSVKNDGVLIPRVAMPIVEQMIEESSKLLKHVNYEPIPGTGRAVIDGAFPEGIWMEMYGKLNELALSFNDVEVDGYKVGGFVVVPNALLEDNDVSLAERIFTKLGQGIGYALDKAIVYGTGTKMPLGIVTRLAQSVKPDGYPATAREWEDLHSSHVISITKTNSTGIPLFQNLLKSFGVAKNKYSNGEKFWAMSETTKTQLVAEALAVNAAGAIVAGIENKMPVVGGAIETLDFIQDNVIIAGYDKLYLLSERGETKLAQSDHVRFIEDQTAFKGTARYDGLPAIAEGFVVIGIAGATVNASAVTFGTDAANA